MSNERIIELMERLGAEVNIHLRQHLPLPHKQLLKARLQAEMLAESIPQGNQQWVRPTPPEWTTEQGLHVPAKVTVVWDRYTPWSAGHRQFLRRSLLGTGLDDADVAHVWAWPIDQQVPPLETQLALMAPATYAAIEAANARYVMLVGKPALTLWRRDMTLKQTQGFSGVWNHRYIVFPVPNPVSVMRDPIEQNQWRQMVYTFGEMIREGEEFELMKRCVEKKCSEPVVIYDKDGIGWCAKHMMKGTSKGERAKGTTRTKVNMQAQETLI